VLCRESYLHDYKSNGGMEWSNHPWSSELPTDAQILMHVFCVYMDRQMSSPIGMPLAINQPSLSLSLSLCLDLVVISNSIGDADRQSGFSQRFFYSYPTEPPDSRVVLFQKTKLPRPHFEVYRNGERYEIMTVCHTTNTTRQ
jgi:hypothetical protein